MILRARQNNNHYIKMLLGAAVTHGADHTLWFRTHTGSFLGPALSPALPREQGGLVRLLRKCFVCYEPARVIECLPSSLEPSVFESQPQNKSTSPFSSGGFQSTEKMGLWRGGGGENWMSNLHHALPGLTQVEKEKAMHRVRPVCLTAVTWPSTVLLEVRI